MARAPINIRSQLAQPPRSQQSAAFKIAKSRFFSRRRRLADNMRDRQRAINAANGKVCVCARVFAI
jgi:hypothetical protein